MTQTPPESPAARSRWTWLAVPVTLVVLIVIVWLVLSRMPFGKGQETLTRAAPPAPEVIAEGSERTATTSQIVNPGEPTDVVATTTTSVPVTETAMPAAIPAPIPAPTPAPIPAPVRPPVRAPVPAPVPTPAPVPVQPTKETEPAPIARTPTPSPPVGELSESEAEDVIRRYVMSRDYYGSSANCTEFANQGFSNRGYTIDVVDVCGGRGRLGRWRVDTLTREVFVQKRDGRFLRP